MRNILEKRFPSLARQLREPSVDDGVSVGAGMLASMMTWIQGLGTRRADVAPVVASAPAPASGSGAAPFEPIKSTGANGEFDAGILMRGLMAYHERHKALLYGDGLVVGIDTELPPAAFPELAALPGFSGAVDSVSLRASDYEDLDAAHRALRAALPDIGALNRDAPRQVAWLINAACVRAAVALAPYALGEPAITLASRDEAGPAARMTFHPTPGQEHAASYIAYSGHDNPLGLGRAARERLAEACLEQFRDAGRAVVLEHVDAMSAMARLDPLSDLVRGFRPDLGDLVIRSAPLGRLSRSYVAFSNLTGVIAADKAFQATLSRQAMVDALRHSTYGYQLAPYLAHTSDAVGAEVARHRHLGALALAAYSTATLERLAAGHCYRYAVTYSYSASASADTSDRPASLPPGAAESAQVFLQAFQSELSAPTRAALTAVSPRYLAPLVLGIGAETPLTERAEVIASPELQATAGRRLGRALSRLVGEFDSPSRLPWLRALACEPARDLMTEGTDDEAAIHGLATLFGVANALRAKSMPQSELRSLPDASSYLVAPEAGAVKAMLQLMGKGRSSKTSLQRTADALLREQFADMSPVTSSFDQDSGALPSAATWEPALAGWIGRGLHYDELEVAFRALDGRKGLWCRGRVTLTVEFERPTTLGDLKFGVQSPYEPFGRVFDANRILSRGETMAAHLLPLGDAAFDNPTVRPVPPAETALPSAQKAHSAAVNAHLAEHLKHVVQVRPLEAAALFASVAEHFSYIEGNLDAPASVGKAKTFRLARASAGRANPLGMGLVIGRAKDPLARTAAGTSLLDIALEFQQTHHALDALTALESHPASQARPAELTETVQRSLGKLIERHPGLLPKALGLGAILDDISIAAWESQHPALKTTESRAAMNAALMSAHIAKSRAAAATSASNDASTTTPTAEEPVQDSAPRRRRMSI